MINVFMLINVVSASLFHLTRKHEDFDLRFSFHFIRLSRSVGLKLLLFLRYIVCKSWQVQERIRVPSRFETLRNCLKLKSNLSRGHMPRKFTLVLANWHFDALMGNLASCNFWGLFANMISVYQSFYWIRYYHHSKR